nr:MAG TPA: hypothetical protein [Bacteriophage sp.]
MNRRPRVMLLPTTAHLLKQSKRQRRGSGRDAWSTRRRHLLVALAQKGLDSLKGVGPRDY